MLPQFGQLSMEGELVAVTISGIAGALQVGWGHTTELRRRSEIKNGTPVGAAEAAPKLNQPRTLPGGRCDSTTRAGARQQRVVRR